MTIEQVVGTCTEPGTPVESNTVYTYEFRTTSTRADGSDPVVEYLTMDKDTGKLYKRSERQRRAGKDFFPEAKVKVFLLSFQLQKLSQKYTVILVFRDAKKRRKRERVCK